MQFNPGDSTGIVDEIDDICQSDNNSYPIESKTRRINGALDRFFTLAFQADGRWTFDDINHGSLPIETINLQDGIQAYALDSFASEINQVLKFEVIDNNDKNHVLSIVDKERIAGEGLALTAYKNTSSSLPDEYDLIGNYIYLYSPPNYTKSNALRAYFNRPASRFDDSDTTKEPGIPSMFHMYIARHASLPYLIEFQKGQKNDIASLIQQDEAAITYYFQNRRKGARRNMRPAVENNE